ncbi:hypothetical protein SIO78_000107 [Enterobacter hormaechei]|nr:hypothetical protein [Enterobacter hormaechei]
MSINWFIVCKDCKVFKDIAQGYEGEVRSTCEGAEIVDFLSNHKYHHLKFVSEYNDDELEGCNEV